jgi:hypothetical protein
MFNQSARAVQRVPVLGFQIDAEGVIQGRNHVIGVNGRAVGISPVAVGGAVDLAAADSAAGYQAERKRCRPDQAAAERSRQKGS